MNDVITKHTKMGEAEKILKNHGVFLSEYWGMGLALLFNSCDWFEVVGFGSHCDFILHTDEETEVRTDGENQD